VHKSWWGKEKIFTSINSNYLTSKDTDSFQSQSDLLYVSVFPSNRLYNVKGAIKETRLMEEEQ
jgi:hypothetical protein